MHVIFANCIPFSLNLVFQVLLCSGYILGLLLVLSEIKNAPGHMSTERINLIFVRVFFSCNFSFPLLEMEEIIYAQKKRGIIFKSGVHNLSFHLSQGICLSLESHLENVRKLRW